MSNILSSFDSHKEVTHMLTDKVITQAKPKEKLYRLSDNIGNGLSLEVSPEGGKRWRFRYRFHGKAKMIRSHFINDF